MDNDIANRESDWLFEGCIWEEFQIGIWQWHHQMEAKYEPWAGGIDIESTLHLFIGYQTYKIIRTAHSTHDSTCTE